MPTIDASQLDVFLLDETLWIASTEIGSPSYDFPFSTFFPCKHPWQRPEVITAVGRFGATSNYPQLYHELAAGGVRLIHAPQQYQLASDLTHWYPLLADVTPRSIWFATPPAVDEIERWQPWPIFLKGSRQTSHHRAWLSIIHSAAEYEQAIEYYRQDPILHWQPLVCREFVPLRSVPGPVTDMIPPSFEFRTFWWYGRCVGFGPYWSALTSYTWTSQEEQAAVAIAQAAVRRLQLPFLVIDVAQTRAGDWMLIECNDAQESGYAGVAPVAMWQNVMAIERERLAAGGDSA